MRHSLTALALAGIASGLYVTAAPGAQDARPPSAKQFAALQKQVQTMQLQVLALQQRVTIFRNQTVDTLQMIETATSEGETCFAALTADELQNTWSQIDRLAVHLGAPPTFGAQTAIGDNHACQSLSVPRPTIDLSVAPTVAPFRAFILWRDGG